MYKRILALGAHTDDVEIGCGATLARLAEEGAQVRVIAFSRAEQSLPEGYPPDALENECRRSFEHMGLGEDAVTVRRYPVRRLGEHRQDILEELVAVARSFAPDLVLTHNSSDTHQDHEVVHNEAARAFRGSSVFGYEIPWNQSEHVIDSYWEVDDRHLKLKSRMLGEYQTQQVKGRSYMTDEFVYSAATFRGFQARMHYAEAFETVRSHRRIGG